MNRVYKIEPADERKALIRVHPNAAYSLGIAKNKLITISFGCLRQFANVNLEKEVPENEIRLSSGLIANLHLPVYPDYEIRNVHNELKIGPFIGMLMSGEDKNLTASFLEKMKIYLREYHEIHGAVTIFALNKVDAVGRLIEGYCYDPVTQSFQTGVFPFPSSIYRAIGLSEYWKNIFLSVIGDHLFNNRYFNKWEMYQWYSQNPVISAAVPFTCIFRSAQDIFYSLEKYGKVYIKPLSGLGGRGITQAKLGGGKYIFKYRENGENRREVINEREAAKEFIETKFSNGRYLIQQPIELIRIKDRIIDFRCIMQKDQAGKWACMAIIGRYGDRGSVVSNISSGGTAIKIGNINRNLIPLPEEKSLHLEENIRAFALQVCSALDEFGLNCGTLGLDVGVDKKGSLWLIEINNRDPDPTIALDVRDRALYVRLKTGILLYLKFLAGFQ